MIWITILSTLICIGIIFLLVMYKEAMRNTVLEHTLEFKEFPQSFQQMNMFFISDIHRRVVSDSLIERIKGKVDFVIIGGDLAEKGVPLSKISANIQKLRAIAPVYFVWGNNDYEIEYHELDALLLENNVKVLDNTRVVFESELGEKICLLGVDDVGLERDRLDLALADCKEEGFRILISHNPDIIKKMSGKEQISLVLSGHTHGGQIRLFPSEKYLKGGVYNHSNTTLFVSNGYGTTLIPLRFRAPAQTHIITLCGGK
ncbi:metallophosphoesterase [Bacillus toyonensis]|uniref:metallophosphoesterase n=1 Tax=Bacillus toyonensis TaxID=155322 RepID=UPI000BF1CA61|nr:metallophosphoesterase [Bacillus toyonensis]MDF9448516.1 metallophosphoesterase family protein [Bacillus toyonensis]MDG1561512.1 metallophosphoesterase family protein [Bacillus toyonensis]PEK89589.1 metallophosphoesterase [Bacillus toyonensis]PGD22656.1 metallophosphoesterase [Bacillus toyonensis]PHD45582.1 metallophosphoesterase [Bacillus toyonensis]